MRILVTAPWGERLGGAEAILHSLILGAGTAGARIEPVFFEEGPWPRELREAGCNASVICAGRMRHPHRWAATVARLSVMLRRRQPDLLLNWSAKTQIYGSPAAILAGMRDRVVWWQQSIPGNGWLDRLATALPAAAVGCYCGAAVQAQTRLRPSLHAFSVSPGIELPSRAARRPLPTQIDAHPDATVIGIVGRLQPWKGQDRLLEAHAALRKRGYRIHTVIVGGDAYGLSPAYAASLPALIDELHLTGEVTMTGHVDDAASYISAMDILVNASDPEPFGLVLLEAMAANVPVVAVNNGGPAEFISHGRTGLLAQSGEPAHLTEALEPLLSAPDRRQAIAENAFQHASTNFTEAAMCNRFVDALRRIAFTSTMPRG